MAKPRLPAPSRPSRRFSIGRTSCAPRTFSKAYGLAGARVGAVITTPENARAFDKIRNHFGMNRIGTAGALAALADQAYLEAVIARIAASRARIGEIAGSAGLAPLPSATNFVPWIRTRREPMPARSSIG